MSGAAMFALVLFVSVGGGLLLWAAVDSEKNGRQVMDRESAEKAARRDTDAAASRRANDRSRRSFDE
ncbi:hypothetical protein [Halorussus pelagicus]|uniref:hypothetical protein n=1 Tax=Halorussus pelagicus TaxID=2505977 RepID=UPI000FFCB183|nr:hypothetical protein [Halorussus pelagicus]